MKEAVRVLCSHSSLGFLHLCWRALANVLCVPVVRFGRAYLDRQVASYHAQQGLSAGGDGLNWEERERTIVLQDIGQFVRV